jgi:UDP-glucose 4-epimerase
VADVNLLVLDKGENQIYNVGSGKGTSVNQLFAYLKELLDFRGEALYAPPRAGELFRSVLDAGKIKKELGWKARTSVKKGLKLTLKWCKKKP